MKKLLLLPLICFQTHCSSDVNIFEYVDRNSDLKIIVLDSNSNLLNRHETEIQINSDKYSRLLKWADNNTDGWAMDPVSHVPADIIVSQGTFRLLYWLHKDYAVIAFTDKDKKSRQYSKSKLNGDLDFLAK